ncbi:MAG: phosphatase PAP2 family protein [Deltaproteobacteria bacterium]|nr:phosphatase PAP2 family protein [Deltaproteobacteria bacterium]
MTQEVTIQKRVKTGLFFLLCFAIGYGATNRFPVFDPKLLPLNFIDQYFGFHPWTVWIYMSDYLLIFMPLFFVHDEAFFKTMTRAFVWNFVIHFTIFFFFPTTMIRLALVEQNFTNTVFSLLRMIDSPVNCFPSQHVSLCFLVACCFWHYRRNLSIVFFLWATLIALSTLTTKQHYFWDVLGGLIVAALIDIFVFRKAKND